MIYEELLAVPVYKGIKTESEKFAGGYKTTTIETWIYENGRAIQAATSHNLGQNFAKMFNIEFEDEKKEKRHVWQTSWGITTRSIGIMIMQHGDNKGLVLPPRVAGIQVVIIPLPFKGKEEETNKIAEKIYYQVKKSKIRVHLDDRDNYTPGWKYNHWELKGVPIRLELGPKDIEKEEIRCVIRHNGEKFQLSWATLAEELDGLLQKIQKDMFLKAKERFHEKEKKASNWEEFLMQLNEKNVVLTPWCEDRECEEKVKDRSGKESKEILGEGEVALTGQAKTLCIPLEYEPLKEGEKCFHCAELAKTRVFWGRSY